MGDPVRGGHGQPGGGLDGCEPPCGQRCDGLLARAVPAMAEVLHQRPGVDADRAGEPAGGIARAGVHRVVAVGVQQPVQHGGAGLLAHHLAAQHDPLARSGRQILAGARRFAEAALDAGVGHRLHLRDRLQAAQVGLRVAVEEDARGEHPAGVDDPLGAPHQLGGLGAPLQFQEGGHVAAGGVLGLERAVEPLHGEPAEGFHEGPVPRDVGGVGSVEGEQEVQVAVGRVTGDGRVEAVLRLEREECLAGLGQPGRRHREVLGDQGRAAGAGSADGGDEGLAGLPVAAHGLRVAGEGIGDRGHRGDQAEPGEGLGRAACAGLPAGHVRCPELHEQGGGLPGQVRPVGRNPLDADRGAQGVAVHQLDGEGARLVEAGHGGGRGGQRGEEQQGGADLAVQGEGVEDDLGDEAEGALRSDHETPQDLDGSVAVQVGVEAVAGGVLDLVLGADPGDQRWVGLDLLLDLHQPVAQGRFGARQLLVGQRVGRVHDGAAGQDEGEGGERAVGVPRGARRHAGRVVGDDPAEGAGDGAGRVGAEDPAVAGQGGVGPHHGGARPDPGPPALLQHLDPGPVAAYVDQDVLSLGLAVERGPGGAEDHLALSAVGVGEDRGDVVEVLGDHHDLGHEAVGGGVGGVADQVGDLPQHLLGAQQLGQLGAQRLRGAGGPVPGDPVGGGAADTAGAQGHRLRFEQRHLRPLASSRPTSGLLSRCAPPARPTGRSAGRRALRAGRRSTEPGSPLPRRFARCADGAAWRGRCR